MARAGPAGKASGTGRLDQAADSTSLATAALAIQPLQCTRCSCSAGRESERFGPRLARGRCEDEGRGGKGEEQTDDEHPAAEKTEHQAKNGRRLGGSEADDEKGAHARDGVAGAADEPSPTEPGGAETLDGADHQEKKGERLRFSGRVGRCPAARTGDPQDDCVDADGSQKRNVNQARDVTLLFAGVHGWILAGS